MKTYKIYQDLTKNKLENQLCLEHDLKEYIKYFKEKTLDIDPKAKEYLVYISPNCNINTIAFKALNNVKRILNYEKADIIIVPNEIKSKWSYNGRTYIRTNLDTNECNTYELFSASYYIPECIDNSNRFTRFKDEFDYQNFHYNKIEKYFSSICPGFIKNIELLNKFDNTKTISVTNFFNLFKSDVEIDLNTIETYLKSRDINTIKIGLNLLIQLDLVKYGLSILQLCLDNHVFEQPLKATSAGKFLYNYFKMSETQYYYDKLSLYKKKFGLFSKEDKIKILDLVVNNLNDKFSKVISEVKTNLEDFDIDWNINTNINYTYDGYTSESVVRK